VTRLFGRGELKAAILDALGEAEPANGYAIMQALADAIGGSWRPSPGAVYPALLGLEDAGLVVGDDDGGGSVTYRLTAAGRGARQGAEGVLSAVADRVRTDPPAPTLGALVDAFASAAPARGHKLAPAGVTAVQRLLESTQARLAKIVDKENNDG
jgi:DNA-binding transcriptional ArsR family regulator